MTTRDILRRHGKSLFCFSTAFSNNSSSLSFFLTPLNTNNLRLRLSLSHPSAGIKRQRESPDAREHSHNNYYYSSRFRLIHCSSLGLSSFRSSPSLPVTSVSLQISPPPRLPSFNVRPPHRGPPKAYSSA